MDSLLCFPVGTFDKHSLKPASCAADSPIFALNVDPPQKKSGWPGRRQGFPSPVSESQDLVITPL